MEPCQFHLPMLHIRKLSLSEGTRQAVSWGPCCNQHPSHLVSFYHCNRHFLSLLHTTSFFLICSLFFYLILLLTGMGPSHLVEVNQKHIPRKFIAGQRARNALGVIPRAVSHQEQKARWFYRAVAYIIACWGMFWVSMHSKWTWLDMHHMHRKQQVSPHLGEDFSITMRV